jgi:hypothetical protein
MLQFISKNPWTTVFVVLVVTACINKTYQLYNR